MKHARARAASSSVEAELKFGLDASHVSLLRQLPLLDIDADRWRSQRLRSVYFDTPSHALRRAGYGLRVRHVGTQRVQTLKRDAPDATALSLRDEWETPCDADRPSLAAFAARMQDDASAEHALALLHEADPALQAVFTTRVRRERCSVRFRHATIELAVDLGDIVSAHDPARHIPVCEIEIELEQGDLDDMLRFARKLARAIPLQPLLASKAARGFALDAPRRRFEALALELNHRKTPPQRVLGDTLRRGMRAVIANVAHPDHVEAVHQARVAVRRMRTLLAVAGEHDTALPAKRLARAQAALVRWHRVLAPVRDWDVFCATGLPALAGNTALADGWRAIAAQAQHVRHDARARLIEFTRGTAFATAALDVERFVLALAAIDDPLVAHADAALRAAHARVVHLFEHGALDETDRRHALRIAVKHLRYVCDALMPRRASTAAYREGLRSLQDALGRLNDAAVAAAFVERLAPASACAAFAAAHAEAAARAARPQVAASIEELAAAGPPQRLISAGD